MKQLFWTLFLCLFLITGPVFSQLKSIGILTPNSKTGICYGETIQFNLALGMTGYPNLVFEWSPRELFINPSIVNPVAKPLETTKFMVKVTDTGNNIVKTDSLIIYVAPLPFVNAGADDSLCVNQFFSLKPSSIRNASGVWKHNGQGTFKYDKTKVNWELTPVYIPAPGELGKVTFVFTGTGLEYCQSVSDTLILTYFDKPGGTILTANDSICSYERFPVSASVSNYISYNWRHTGDGILLNDKTLNPTYIPHEYDHDKILIILDVTGDGCVNSDTVSLQVIPMNILVNPDDGEFCEGQRAYLRATFSPDYRYEWSTGETSNQIAVTPFQNTAYTVNVTNKIGCTFKDTINITVLKSPKITKIVTYPEDKKIAVSPDNLVTYTFYLGDKVLQQSASNIFYYGDYLGIADTIDIIVTNEFGCSNYAGDSSADDNSHFVIPALKMVNAFSPNGDGTNDLLLPNRKIVVFDRTDKVLYQGWEGWDGSCNGREMPVGTYFYAVFDENNKIFYKGPVTLLR